MKKLFLGVLMIVFGLTANAQERGSGDIEVTPFVSFTQSYFNGDNTQFYDIKSGASFGVKGDYFFNDRWSLRSGLIYDSMGAKVNGGADVELSYISIPLNANWHFGSTRKWNLNFGMTPSFLTRAEANEIDIKDEVKSFQFGISYGIGYKLAVSDDFSLLFDMQGLVGVSNINDIPGSNVTQMNASSNLGIGGVFTF